MPAKSDHRIERAAVIRGHTFATAPAWGYGEVEEFFFVLPPQLGSRAKHLGDERHDIAAERTPENGRPEILAKDLEDDVAIEVPVAATEDQENVFVEVPKQRLFHGALNQYGSRWGEYKQVRRCGTNQEHSHKRAVFASCLEAWLIPSKIVGLE